MSANPATTSSSGHSCLADWSGSRAVINVNNALENSKLPDAHGRYAKMARMSTLVRIGILCIAALILAGAIYHRVQTSRFEARLVRAQPEEVANDTEFRRFAEAVAPAVYSRNCAACHGANLLGDRSRGAPNLTDSVFLYGQGSVSDIETTILYGIRSGHPKAHNLMDMPALGRTGQLTPQDVREVVEFVLTLSGQPHDATAAERGPRNFCGSGGLLRLSRGRRARHRRLRNAGVDRAGRRLVVRRRSGHLVQNDFRWTDMVCARRGSGKLSFVQIRALSLFLYEKSHHE